MTPLLRNGVCAGTAAFLAACSTPQPVTTVPTYPPSDYTTLETSMDALPGWQTDSMERALPALRKSCAVFAKKPPEILIGKDFFARTAADWQHACAGIEDLKTTDDVRNWLKPKFTPYKISAKDGTSTGVFTGYYEAEIKGSVFFSPYYPYPVYGKPIDLVTRKQDGKQVTGRLENGKVVPYPTREAIETGAIENLAPILFWTDDLVDLHITHIQGSARVALPDGREFRIGYAGNNGHPFKGLGRILLDSKLVEPGQASMPKIRAWLHQYPRQAERIMWQNPRYIFFRSITGEGPIGAFGVPLTPRRSLAVDREVVPLGAPVWLDTSDPDGVPLQRLMVAQDIGSAIKGAVRGDFFWGSGAAAFAKAGRMKSQGEYYVLIPTVQTMPELLPQPMPLPLPTETTPDTAQETGEAPPQTPKDPSEASVSPAA